MADRYETIAAYLDGSLAGEQRARFEAEMELDPSLAEEVRQWQANDALLRAAFPVSDADIDVMMLDRLGLAEPNRHIAAANDNWWSWGRIGIAGGALAASIAVAMVLFQPAPTRLVDDQQFQTAMETLPSGQGAKLASGSEIAPVLTFRASDGRYCREFSGEKVGGGIACRENGAWKIEARIARGASIGNTDEIQTASGEAPQNLDTVMDRLQASDPLDAQKEKHAISLTWKE